MSFNRDVRFDWIIRFSCIQLRGKILNEENGGKRNFEEPATTWSRYPAAIVQPVGVSGSRVTNGQEKISTHEKRSRVRVRASYRKIR